MEYRLDLATLLHMLGQSTGTLQTDSLHISGVRARCRAFLRLEQGQIMDCSITDEYGKLLFAQEVALKRLESQVLEWHYTATPASLPTPRDDSQPQWSSSVTFSPARLRRVGQISQGELNALPRFYRNIYSLTATPTTIERIVMLLARDQEPRQVQEAIMVLVQQGYLQWENTSQIS